MIVSEKRKEANRRNAQKSTGPRTEEGKDRSRENAIKHGLTARVVFREDAEAMQEEAEAVFYSLKPRNPFQAGLAEQVALCNVRIRRAQAIERRIRDKRALRAMTSWDEDRKLDAERLAAGLAARPAEVVAELRRTPQGCDWLIGRWAILAYLAEDNEKWDDGQTRLAHDLLGTPEIFRVGQVGLVIDTDGRRSGEMRVPADLAREQIADLREAREVAAIHDEVERALAESDMTDEASPELGRLRRHEAALHNKLRWSLAELKVPLPEHRAVHELRPMFHPQTEEEIEAEAQAELDERIAKEEKFAAEYHANKARLEEEERKKAEAKALRSEKARARSRAQNEPTPEPQNEPIAGPEAPATPRVDARLRQAEARREARKRKLDRLRA